MSGASAGRTDTTTWGPRNGGEPLGGPIHRGIVESGKAAFTCDAQHRYLGSPFPLPGPSDAEDRNIFMRIDESAQWVQAQDARVSMPQGGAARDPMTLVVEIGMRPSAASEK